MFNVLRVRHGRRRNHRQDQLSILRSWFDEHAGDPYPSPSEKVWLAQQVGMEVRQVEHCARQTLFELSLAITHTK